MSELQAIAEKEDWESRVWELNAVPIGIVRNFVRLHRGLHVVTPWERRSAISGECFSTCDIAKIEDSPFVRLYNGMRAIVSPDLHVLEDGQYRSTLTTFHLPEGYHINYDGALREQFTDDIQGVAEYGPAA